MGITKGTCKTKVIQTDLSISTHIFHNPAYPGIIQTYLGIIRTLCNPGIFRDMTYLVVMFAPLEKNGSRGEQGLEGLSFGIPWNFVKEQVLHNFIKYFSEVWLSQIVNIALNGKLPNPGNLLLSTA